MAPRNLPSLFSSLARSTSTGTPTRWTLLRTLKSENINDITGDLHGTVTFTPLRSPSKTATPSDSQNGDTGAGNTDLLYSEEGSLPPSFGPGLRWTKKYIWRLSPEGRISVWFVKVDKSTKESKEAEADYLFHEFNFDPSSNPDSGSSPNSSPATSPDSNSATEFITPPTPPVPMHISATGSDTNTRVITARGNHLCINDMYRTAYAFRIDEGSGEVLTWASRHVVRGPKKGQDIVNFYSRAV
ncbi:hypothetical protein BDV06DRAFT_216786 [Aspergillus oleicola]